MQQVSAAVPKPLLRINGKSFLQWSIDSLPIMTGDQVFIMHPAAVPAAHVSKSISNDVNKVAQLIPVKNVTRGQLETASLAYSFIPQENSVCIYNSDTYFSAPDLLSVIQSDQWDGLIPCSVESGDSWSFCVVEGSQDRILPVTRVAEKQRVSRWCSVGAYWFRNVSILSDCTRVELSSKNLGAEIYVAPVYNRLIDQNLKIGMVPAQTFRPMGSVEQIEKYWGLTLAAVRAQNEPR